MRLGILTFHAQLNYGGVLQAVALQMALLGHGYDACVVDRWLSKDNDKLVGPWARGGIKERAIIGLRVLLGLGWGGRLIRHRRTTRFVVSNLRLTREHFLEWSDSIAQQLAVDCLVVGSDQLWSCRWEVPNVYLLNGAPSGLSAITYAISFGMHRVPESLEQLYRQGVGRFSAVSVREIEGKRLVEALGGVATHVVDPTLLLEQSIWRGMVTEEGGERKLLTVYVLAEDVEVLLPQLEAFARRMKVEVRVLVNAYVRPIPRTPSLLAYQIRWLMHRLLSPVSLCLSAGPKEFLNAFAQADWVLSDSFHALMFSSIFDKQVAILRSRSDDRKDMFARIQEFVETTTDGPVIEDTVESALARFERGERMSFRQDVIVKRREASWAWLRAALDKVERERAERKD